MATGDRVDPFTGYNFHVEFANASDAVAAFREVSGMTVNTDVIEYREGNSKDLHPKKLMGLRKSSNLVFKKGITVNKELWLWYRQIVNGVHDRRNGSVVLHDELGQEVLTWNFYEAWPTKIEFPTLNANTNEVAVISMELVVEKLELVS